MPKPYSLDLRDRVIGLVASGSSARAAGRLFGVSESTAVKWVQRWRRTGSVAAHRMGGYKRSVLDVHADMVLELISERPHLTLEEIRAELRGAGIRVGYGTVWRFFERHGISIKKTVHTSEQERPDVARARMLWRLGQPDLEGVDGPTFRHRDVPMWLPELTA